MCCRVSWEAEEVSSALVAGRESACRQPHQGLGPPGNSAIWPLPNPLSRVIKLEVMVGWRLGGGPSASGLCWRAWHRNHGSILTQKECYWKQLICRTELRLILENSKTQLRHETLILYLIRERRLKAKLIIIIWVLALVSFNLDRGKAQKPWNECGAGILRF